MSVQTPQNQLNLVMIQANPTVGDIQKNLDHIIAMRRQHKDADLIVLSECFLTGYPLQDLVNLPHFVAAVSAAVQDLAEQVRAEPGPAVLFGAPTPGADKPYNSAILIRPDGTTSITHKQELPNNDVFDEVRTFAQGSGKAQPLRLNDQWNLGVMICEDGWHKKVASDLEGEGADLLISINGSPARLGKREQRMTHMQRRVAETHLPLIYINQFGGQDELVFDGSSFALDSQNKTVAQLNFMEADTAKITATRQLDGRVQIVQPGRNRVLTLTPSDCELMYRAGMLGTRDYAQKNGIAFARAGMSGGADSTLAGIIAADALGSDGFRGWRLPSSLTGQESMDLATVFMRGIGCKLETVRIDGVVEEFLKSVTSINARDDTARMNAYECLQARLRMVVLMYANNMMGGMLLGTSNKSESSVGYTTIYGDMAGQYNPIKDLYKTDVWAVMNWRNQNVPADSFCYIENPIPQRIIDRPPTAELAVGQSDEASLGSYEILDPFLKALIEQQLDAETARQQVERDLGVDILPTYATKIANMVYAAEFKRRQACIGPQIRPNSFGLARRYPITNQYREQERPHHVATQRNIGIPAYR